MSNNQQSKQLGKEKSNLVHKLKKLLPTKPTSLLPIGLGINTAYYLANRKPEYGGMRGKGIEIKEKYVLSGITIELCRDATTALCFYGGGPVLGLFAYLSLTYISDAAGFGGAQF